jgi:hypothetical protein
MKRQGGMIPSVLFEGTAPALQEYLFVIQVGHLRDRNKKV